MALVLSGVNHLITFINGFTESNLFPINNYIHFNLDICMFDLKNNKIIKNKIIIKA